MNTGLIKEKEVRVAILSMYRDQESQGMKYLHSILEKQSAAHPEYRLSWKVFATRKKNELPEPEDFDFFISTGGPGDPHDGKGLAWENNYFAFLEKIRSDIASGQKPKYLFSICHSFQLLCRWLNIAEVVPRPETCFGIFSCKPEQSAKEDPLFSRLPDPFLVVENRNWQCIHPDYEKMNELGIQVLARELTPPAPDAEPALLALRLSPYWIATQFHPETNPAEMRAVYSAGKKKDEVLEKYGPGKLEEINSRLDQQNPALADTFHCLLPGFLSEAAAEALK